MPDGARQLVEFEEEVMIKQLSQLTAILFFLLSVMAGEGLAKEDPTRRKENPFFPKAGHVMDNKPDLVIRKFGIGVEAQYRNKKYLKVWVHNAGRQPVPAGVVIRVDYGSTEKGKTVRWSIPPGRGLWVEFKDIRLVKCQRRHLIAKADVGDRIDDVYEDNNERAETFGLPCPDLFVQDIRPVKEGGRWRIQVTIANKATSEARRQSSNTGHTVALD